MRRFLGLAILATVALWQGLALAQTAAEASSGQKTYEVILKVLFPTVWTALSPYLTRGVTWAMLHVVQRVPQPFQIVISSVIGATLAGIAGAIPDFPLTVESAATMGATGGAAGQFLLQKTMPPIPGEPGTGGIVK